MLYFSILIEESISPKFHSPI